MNANCEGSDFSLWGGGWIDFIEFGDLRLRHWSCRLISCCKYLSFMWERVDFGDFLINLHL